jgi:hypothetical protein
MKRPCANNIFTNPEGWAGKAVGALWRYRFMQGITLFGSVALFLIFIFVSKRRDCVDYVAVAVLISAFSIAFPLMYLRALRSLYIKTQRFKGNQQGVAPDAQKTTPGDLNRYLLF